jgi:hypothetical protein
VGSGGGIGCARADLDRIPGFSSSFINCEVNADRSTLERAMTEAADLQEWFNFGGAPGEDPTRLLARTASFCSERSGHFDAFDQGISFFLPNMTWLQPPGWVHHMVDAAYAPNAVGVASPAGYPASAQLADGGSSLTIQIVNAKQTPGVVTFRVAGFAPSGAAAVTTLNGTALTDGNTPAAPLAMAPWASSAPWAGGAPAACGLSPRLPTKMTTSTAMARTRAPGRPTRHTSSGSGARGGVVHARCLPLRT